MIRGRAFIVAALIAAAGVAPARAQDAISADQAVREALDHNLSLLAERFNIQAADAAILTASLKPNPVLTLNGMRPDRALVDAGGDGAARAHRPRA